MSTKHPISSKLGNIHSSGFNYIYQFKTTDFKWSIAAIIVSKLLDGNVPW